MCFHHVSMLFVAQHHLLLKESWANNGLEESDRHITMIRRWPFLGTKTGPAFGSGAILWQYFVYCCNSHVTIVQHHYHDNFDSFVTCFDVLEKVRDIVFVLQAVSAACAWSPAIFTVSQQFFPGSPTSISNPQPWNNVKAASRESTF